MADLVVQQVKDKLDIVEVVSSYIKLEKTGINLRAPCPFHGEKKPSFFVSPTRQSFKCFGCGKSGSVFDFVMEIEGIEFGDAFRMLAKRAGVELKSFSPELQTKRQRLYQICEIATKFYEKQLEDGIAGQKAKQYLIERGIKPETIKQFRLGYAPDAWRTLSDFLISKGYNRGEVVEAGLAVKSEKANIPYDRFRARIIFPVFDLSSQVIGFGGRVFDNDENIAKYLNTSNTLLYDKSKVLYGLNFGKIEVRRNNYCILTEGYTDVILSHQAGFINTVSSSGTALTPHQLAIIKRYTPNLLTAFDMDSAGGLATQRGIELAMAQDFEVKVIAMEKDKDPADIILDNPLKWQEAIEGAKEIMDFYFINATSKFDPSIPQDKKQIAAFLLPFIKKTPNKILQSHWLQKLANILKVSESSILEELRTTSIQEPARYTSNVPSNQTPVYSRGVKPRHQLLEERVLSLILKQPKTIALVNNDLINDFSPEIKTIFTNLKENKPACDIKLENKEAQELLTNCLFESESITEQDVTSEVTLCLNQLKYLRDKNQLELLAKAISIAEEQKDEEKLKSLVGQFNQLAQASNSHASNQKTN